MKKIIYLLSLVLLVGCTAKKDIAVVTSTPAPTPTSTLITTPTPSPTIDPYTILPLDLPDVDDPVNYEIINNPYIKSDTGVKSFHTYCEKDQYHGFTTAEEEDDGAVVLRVILEENNIIKIFRHISTCMYYYGNYSFIEDKLYSFYGYKLTVEEISQLDHVEEFIPDYNKFDYNLRYFKFVDNLLYFLPEGLSQEEAKAYDIKNESGCGILYKNENN